MESKQQIDSLIRDLQERAKELKCLYRIDELLASDSPLEQLLQQVIAIIPCGWQFPELCRVCIVYDGKTYQADNFEQTSWVQSTKIVVQEKVVGLLSIYYEQETPQSETGYFLKEEEKLLTTIAERIGHAILYRRLRRVFQDWEGARKELAEREKGQWQGVVQLLRQADQKLFLYISQKMLHYLSLSGVEKARSLLQQFNISKKLDRQQIADVNRPSQKQPMADILKLSDQVFQIASENLHGERILALIQKWIREDKSRFLVKVIDNANSSLSEVIDALTRYRYLETEGGQLSGPIENVLRVSLIRRFFYDSLDFINIAKKFIDVADCYELVQRIVFPSRSHGRLGGKSAGLFLAAKILEKNRQDSELLDSIRIPKTWYISSDGLMCFVLYNNLEDVIEQKYKEVDEIQLEYPNIVQIFKNSHFTPEIVKGLSLALDDLGTDPIIVRSSSLLEDRLGSVFSGKYKSLFLANQGSKSHRLEALLDAIAEVYASTFAADPIEYRKERGLLDFHEEMGIMIQQVVGTKIDNYFFPSFAGVAFSRNEFRWSARISREDGLIRMVPGLGTRAVDRVTDDYPILLAPGKPDLRVNVTPEEVVRYASKKIDIINLQTNTFETIDIDEALKKYGQDIPGIENMVSIFDDNYIRNPSSSFNIDFDKDRLVVTFGGLIERTPFVKKIAALLKLLQQEIDTPVDIEFAHDGKDLYLLQCRPQCYSQENLPSPIPKDVAQDKIIFSANRNVSNGFVPNITHIVYVDPDAYNQLEDMDRLKDIGRVVGRLNKLLPKRQFILMGPGRWGSRGDIKLGIDIGYADINKTAVLIEIARKKGNYLPELSFGTHFFQDLVESSIRYLPLYPDDENVIFNQHFLHKTRNILPELLPKFADLAHVVRVIDVPKSTDGLILRLLMNGDLDEALAFLADSTSQVYQPIESQEIADPQSSDFWRWRAHMAQKIAQHLDPERFGVQALYLFGSAKNATAGPGSDIDLLLHFRGTEEQRQHLLLWLEGWSLSLAERNYLLTGYRTDGLLDVHIVTDEDIANKTSYAVKIGAITDAARLLPLCATAAK